MNYKVIQPVAALMIGLTLFGSLTQLQRAFAGEPKPPQLTYNFSFDIPNHGMIDLYHNAYSKRDRVSNSLYVLRNTAVEDLLNTRRGIKVLLGGTEGARKASGKKDLSFDVPGGIVDLYLLGNLGGSPTNTLGRSESSSTLPGPVTVHRTVDTDSIPEIAYAIRWLGTHEPKYDEVLRTRLLTGLTYVSAQLTKYDQQLKFLQTDFFNNPAVSNEFYNAELQDWVGETSKAGVDPDIKAMTKHAESVWMATHQMTSALSVLAGHRDYLLDRYHLLGIEIDGKPLYKILYEKMETVGFPRADMIQKPVVEHLPPGIEPIPMPSEFDKAVDSSFNVLLGAHQNQILSELNLAVNARIDEALLISLAANTERLTALTSVTDYDGDRSSPLLELARYDDLWSTATKKYEYLSNVIDYTGAHEEISGYFERVDKTKRHVRYTAYGVGIGIGVAATIFSGGVVAEVGGVAVEGAGTVAAAATWLGIPLRAWMIGSGLMTAAQATVDYVDSKEAATVAKGLFLGTSNQGSYANMTNAIAMEESDYKMMIGSLILLGAESKVLSLLAKARPLIQAGGKTLVRITTEELTIARDAVTALSARAEKLAPMGRALISVVKQLLGMAVGIDRAVALEEAVPMVARQLRMTPAAVWNSLQENRLVGYLIRDWRARDMSAKILVKPSLLKQMVSQQANNLAVTVVTEYMARGKHMLTDQSGEFAEDVVQGALVTVALVWKGQNMLPEAREAVFGASNIKVSGGFMSTGTRQFLGTAGFNTLVGLSVNGVSALATETNGAIKQWGSPDAKSLGDRAKTVGLNTAYGGLFTGVSSTSRYAVLKVVDNVISKAMAGNPSAQIVIQSMWTANNIFGGWSYVKVGKLTGFLEDGVPVKSDPNIQELNPRINGLQFEDLGGTYLRVDGDASDAGFMFDFLRGGEQTVDAPVAN